MNIKEKNILSLAYLGDAVFELEIRSYFINLGIQKVNNLQKEALNYVSAKNQSKYMNYLVNNNFLTEEELDVARRGRNAKVFSHPKNVDIVTYKWATALESLFGYLYVKNDVNRIKELINLIIGVGLL